MPPLDDDLNFQQFVDDLEALRGQTPLHKPGEHIVNRILERLPPPQRVASRQGWTLFRWAVPFSVGSAVASVGFLFFSPYAPFDIVRKEPSRIASSIKSPDSEELQAARVSESQTKTKDERITAVRLTRLMNDYQTASRWLADAGVSSPANKAYGLKVLTDLAATGFTDTDWRLYRAALPAPRDITELVQGAQCVHLWKRSGAAADAWQPVLQKAAELKRIPDVLMVSQTVRAEHIDPELLMSTLNSGLTGDKNVENILTEIRTVALPSDALPQDAQQVRVEQVPADLPREE